MLSGWFRRQRGPDSTIGDAAPAPGESGIVQAERLWSAGRTEEALRVIAALTEQPEADAGAISAHARWLAMQGDVAGSRRLFERMTRIAPENPDGWLGLGNLAQLTGSPADGVAWYRRAHALVPEDHGILAALVHALGATGDHDGAVEAAGHGTARDNAPAAAWDLYARTLQAAGRVGDATSAWRRALELAPDDADVLARLGMHLCGQKQFDDARPLLERAIALPNAPATAWANLAVVYRTEARFDEALSMAEHAASMGLTSPEARMERGMLLLALQRYDEGWFHYEARFQVPGLPSAERKDARSPWRGEPLQGRSILVWAEQGVGDTLQFVRYVRLLEAKGARVHVEAQPATVRLLRDSGIGTEVRAQGADWRDVAPDYHCALMSLPYRFATTYATIPWSGPYLRPPREERFAQAFAGVRGLRVGFVWAGNPAQASDWARSVTWETFAPLARIPGLVAVPLQMGAAGAHWHTVEGGQAIDLRSQLEDFADTAAVIAHLDVVVTVCTSVAHLSAAMGRDTFVMLGHAADWRWLPGPDHTPWYPTATLFRCPAPGDWATTTGHAAKALAMRARAIVRDD